MVVSQLRQVIMQQEDLNALQKAFYMHYGKEHHGLKAQIVMLPSVFHKWRAK